MMRLSPPGYLKFSQATSFELAYGGGEVNIAISLVFGNQNSPRVVHAAS